MGKIPNDLPDTETSVAAGLSLAALPAVEELNSDTDLEVNKINLANVTRDHTPTIDPSVFQHSPETVKSGIPALDHFPAPPVHFPLPHLRGVSKNSPDGPIGNPSSYGRGITSPVTMSPLT